MNEVADALIEAVLDDKLHLDTCPSCGEEDRLVPFDAEGEGEIHLVSLCELRPSLILPPRLDPCEGILSRDEVDFVGRSDPEPSQRWEKPENLYEDLVEAREQIRESEPDYYTPPKGWRLL